jgi:hypothetical protein
MAEERRQLGQKIIQVGTSAIPCSDAMNSRRMPEVVQTRVVDRAVTKVRAPGDWQGVCGESPLR